MNGEKKAIPSPPTPPISVDASKQISGPAIGLLVTGIIGGIFSLASFFSISIGTGLSTLWWERFPERYEELWEGALGIGGSLIALCVAGFIIYAALKMRELTQWRLAVAASVSAMIPCVSPCCLIGLPIGIWSLIILTKPEIKSAFHGCPYYLTIPLYRVDRDLMPSRRSGVLCLISSCFLFVLSFSSVQ